MRLFAKRLRFAARERYTRKVPWIAAGVSFDQIQIGVVHVKSVHRFDGRDLSGLTPF